MGIVKFFSKFSKSLGLHDYAYNYYNSKEDYYRSLLRDDNISRLSSLLAEQQKAIHNSEIQVKFRKIAFGTFINQVIKKLGKPRFAIDNQKYLKGHQVLFYRFQIDSFKTIAQLHFLNGYFFYAKYTFRNLNSSELKKVVSILKSKYFYQPQFDENITKVKDKDNNVISLEKSLYLNIKYISGNSDFTEYLNQQFLKQLEKRKEKETHRLVTLRESL